jgi:hypothetical protein
MKGHPDIGGILYWAVGEGEKGWDALCPSPNLGDSQLVTEIARQALAPEQIVYLDATNQESETPTRCREITAEFQGTDLASNGFQSLREFGLFGGDATEEPDSGFMIDYVIHPRIDLSSEAKLGRKLRLTFGTGAVEPEAALVRLGARLLVDSLGGLGRSTRAP